MPTLAPSRIRLACLLLLPAFAAVSAQPEATPPEPAGAETEEAAEVPASAPQRGPLHEALDWTIEGLRLYMAGDRAGAHRSLEDARISLLEAQLPAPMQEKELGLLACCLPPDVAHLDPGALLRELNAEKERGAENLSEREVVEREARRILARFKSQPNEAQFAELIHSVVTYIDYYRGHQRGFFERSYQRKHKYWPVITQTFAGFNLPEELAYVALVESGFNPRAVSHANARGLWQFIPSTGQRYGLLRSEDFYDVAKATRAAADYLQDLLSIFGPNSFLLALAAYNAGELRVMNCLRGVEDAFGERSFWEIRSCFARETQEYIPRILAAAVLASDPQRFGFELASMEEVRSRSEVVVFPSLTALDEIASRVGISSAEIRLANTDLASNARATPARNFPLYLPSGSAARLADLLVPNRPEPREAQGEAPAGGARLVYTVRAGNTLSTVAELFHVRYRSIMTWNRLRSSRLATGQKLVIYPSRKVSSRTHQVKKGETFSTIARRYGIEVEDLRTANGLTEGSRPRPGQKLLVYVAG